MFRLGLGLGLTNRFRAGISLPAGQGLLAISGQALASFVGSALRRGDLTAQGAGTAAFVGSSVTSGQGQWAASGQALASFVGSALAQGALTVQGAGATAFVGSSVAAGSGALSSAGAAAASFTGSALGRGSLSSAGVASSALVGSTTGGAVNAPAITLANQELWADPYKPELIFSFDPAIVAGDTTTLRAAQDAIFSTDLRTSSAITLTADHLGGDPIDFGMAALVDGAWWLSAKNNHGGADTAWTTSPPSFTIGAGATGAGQPMGLLLALTRVSSGGQPTGLLLSLTKAA